MTRPKAEFSTTATEARNNFSDIVGRAAFGKERVIIQRRGKPVAAIVPPEDLEFLTDGDASEGPDQKLISAALSMAADNLFGTLFRRTNHPDGRIIFDYVSSGAQELYGIPAEEIMADPSVFLELLPPDSRNAFLAQVNHCNRTLEQFVLIFRIIHRDGQERWIKSRATPTPKPDGRIVWHGVAIDITDQQQAQIELSESRERLRDFAEAASDYFWETGPDHRYRKFNTAGDALRESKTFTPGRTPWELAGIDPDTDSHWRCIVDDMAAARPFRDFRVKTRSDAQERHWSVSGKPVYLADGSFDGYRGTTRDITEIVEAERRADTAENQLRTVAQNIPGIVYRRVLHPDGRVEIPYVSEGAKEVFGIDATAIMRDPQELMDVLHPDDREPWTEAVRKSGETLEGFDMDVRFTAPDGEIHWSRSASRPRKMPDGSIVWDGVGLDITEQKRAELEASDLSSRLGQVLEETPIEFYFLDPATMRFLDANRFACESLGYSIDELRELTPADLDPTYDPRRATFVMEDSGIPDGNFTGPRHAVFESIMCRKDGTEYPVEFRVQPTLIRGKKVLFAIAQNIEERRARERDRMNKSLRVRALNQTLMDLATSRAIASGNLRSAAKKITSSTSEALDLQRASVWLYTEDRSKIVCEDLYISEERSHYRDFELRRSDFEPFFDALERDRTIAATDAISDPRTNALAEKYLIPQGVTAMLEVPIRVGGEVVGVACHEVTGGTRDWTVEEQNFIAAIGDLLAVAVQASRRKEAEAKIRLSEERFRDVAEVASDWFWEMDANLRFSYFSDRIRQVGGLNPDEIVGLTRQEFARSTGRELGDEWRPHLEDVEAHRPFRDFRYAYESADGILVHVSISGKPLFDDDGEFLGYRGTGTNVTSEAEAALAHRRAQEQAELANRAKSEFLANMSHELRTPLNAIIGFSEILDSETFGPIDSPQYRGYVGDILDSGRHLLSLINDILDLSKVEAGKLELSDNEISVAEMLASCRRLIQPRVEEGGLSLVISAAEETPLLVADERKIKQVLLNLLSNSVKFSDPGGAITASSGRAPDGGVVISIHDTGIGIAADDIRRIMIPFEQAASSMTRRHEGSGLGLPLAKSLIELHEGTLHLESTPGEGTTATIHFPPQRSRDISAAAE